MKMTKQDMKTNIKTLKQTKRHENKRKDMIANIQKDMKTMKNT